MEKKLVKREISESGEPLKETPKKKGNKSWKPAGRIGHLNVPDSHKGRWVHLEDANIQRKLEEGWVFVNETNFPQVGRLTAPGGAVMDDRQVKDGTPLGGAVRYRDMVGMMLDSELVEARSEYHMQQTKDQTDARVRANKSKEQLGVNAHALRDPTLIIE